MILFYFIVLIAIVQTVVNWLLLNIIRVEVEMVWSLGVMDPGFENWGSWVLVGPKISTTDGGM